MPRKRPEQLEQTRRDILDAAERCFAEHGYRRATIKQIAAEASITVPTVYAYFRGKAAVLEALEARIGDEIPRMLDVLLPRGLTFAQKLELFLAHQLRLVEAEHDRFRFIVDAHMPEALGRRYLAVLTEWLRTQDENDDLRFDPAYTALVVTGVWSACFRAWFQQGARAGELVAMAPKIADTLLGGITT